MKVKQVTFFLLLSSQAMANKDAIQLDTVLVKINPRTLRTGNRQSDQYLKKLIFKNSKSHASSIIFYSKNISCKGNSCLAVGEMSIAGKKTFTHLPLNFVKISEKHYSVEGSGRTRLSDFNIKAPAFLNARVDDEVNFDFTATARYNSNKSEPKLLIERGSVRFTVTTNILETTIEGHGSDLRGHAALLTSSRILSKSLSSRR